MRRKLLPLFLAVALCALFCPVPPARAVSTSAGSAILMEADTGRVLYAQGGTERRAIASVTKLMTALVAVERAGDLDAVVKVDPAAAGVEGTSMYLAPGEELPLRDLLYGLLLSSGNDAAVAIAIHCAGDTETFVGWMNDKAAQLGMENTHFCNPNGLDAQEHYSSAYDLALLARAVLAQPTLSQIAATRTITLGSRTLINHNKLLWRYDGCIGLKTGYTTQAGRTLVSAARRGDTTLIAVTLKDPNDWADHAALLDYGFANYHTHLLAREGKSLGGVPVRGSLSPVVKVSTKNGAVYPLASSEVVTARLDLPKTLSAPILKGQTVGALTFYLDGQPIGKVDLVADTPAYKHQKR